MPRSIEETFKSEIDEVETGDGDYMQNPGGRDWPEKEGEKQRSALNIAALLSGLDNEEI